MAEQKRADLLSSRLMFVLAGIAMCIGTGNFWRFPRIAVMYQGNFLLIYVITLVLISVPVIITEILIGRVGRRGPGAAFKYVVGEKYQWMGNFLMVCNTGIFFYYIIITGWVLRYFFEIAFVGVPEDTVSLWNSVSSSFANNYGFAVIVLALTSGILLSGIRGRMEVASAIMVGLVFVLLIILAIYANMLPGADAGRDYLWNIDPKGLLNAETWLQAMTQVCWSSGPGWGIWLTIAAYARLREDINTTAVNGVFGDSIGGYLAGMVVVPVLFAAIPETLEIVKIAGSGNVGVGFIAFPAAIAEMPLGRLFGAIFFLGMFFAALSSCLWVMEVPVRTLQDYGFSRKKAVLTIALLSLIFSAFSAYSLDFLWNQDMVWGVGLFIGTMFTCYAAIKIGLDKIGSFADGYSIIKIGKFYKISLPIALIMTVVVFVWWIVQSISWYPETWWNPLEVYSPGTMLLQWAIVLALFIGLNKYLSNRAKPEYSTVSELEIPYEGGALEKLRGEEVR